MLAVSHLWLHTAPMSGEDTTGGLPSLPPGRDVEADVPGVDRPSDAPGSIGTRPVTHSVAGPGRGRPPRGPDSFGLPVPPRRYDVHHESSGFPTLPPTQVRGCGGKASVMPTYKGLRGDKVRPSTTDHPGPVW